ncbi:MAG: class I adenylate-forming enzyme family protein [bacterium]
MNVVDFLFEKAQTLTKEFVAGSKERITCRELCLEVRALAGFIHSEYGSGNEFMLLSDNSLFFIICYLAIMKSGNVVVLVAPRISGAQLEAIITRCSLRAVFLEDKFRSKVPETYRRYTESLLTAMSDGEGVLDAQTDDDDVAAIIFTSGSTGEQKGVMLTHKNIRVNTESILSCMGITAEDRMEVVLPFYYCYGTSLLHTHLRAGGSIVINKSVFLGSVIKEIEDYRCTGFAGVPATYQILIHRTNFLEQDFPSLRFLAQAGGKLTTPYIAQIVNEFKDKTFFVMYGATEATARLSCLDPRRLREKLGSIGKGIPGVTLEVLDENDHPVKPGEEGQITARGDNIMKGYYKDPEGTKEVLKNGRYYTGDLATVDEDGFIYVVGRARNIIKSAGFRISPDEVEEVIAKVDKVLQSVVIGVPDELMGEAVAAVVETNAPSEELKNDIISTCNSSLASYKVPRRVVFSSRFPLNSSGKVDVPRLKQMATAKITTAEVETSLLTIE